MQSLCPFPATSQSTTSRAPIRTADRAAVLYPGASDSAATTNQTRHSTGRARIIPSTKYGWGRHRTWFAPARLQQPPVYRTRQKNRPQRLNAKIAHHHEKQKGDEGIGDPGCNGFEEKGIRRRASRPEHPLRVKSEDVAGEEGVGEVGARRGISGSYYLMFCIQPTLYLPMHLVRGRRLHPNAVRVPVHPLATARVHPVGQVNLSPLFALLQVHSRCIQLRFEPIPVLEGQKSFKSNLEMRNSLSLARINLTYQLLHCVQIHVDRSTPQSRSVMHAYDRVHRYSVWHFPVR